MGPVLRRMARTVRPVPVPRITRQRVLTQEEAPLQLLTAREVPLKATTPAPAQLRAACLGRVPTGPQQPARLTTQGPGPMPLRRKAPMPTGATEAPSSQETARLPIPSTRPPRKEQHRRCRLPRVAEVEPQWAQTVTPSLRGKRQMATSMPLPMAMFTKTAEAVGNRHMALLPEDGGNSRAAAVPRPSVEAVAAADGNRGRRALVVRSAEAAVADGMVADRVTSGRYCWRCW